MAFVRFLNRLFLGRYIRTSEARLVESSFVPAGAEVKRLMTILRAHRYRYAAYQYLSFFRFSAEQNAIDHP